MPERSSISQISQWGVETTPGTAVAANKLLQALMVAGGVKQTMQTFRGSGAKYPVVAAQGKEWFEAALSGPLVYNDVVYPLSSVLAGATPVQQGGSAAYQWDFNPSSSTEDTVKTFTIEQGSAVRAHKLAHAIVNEFGVAINRETVDVSGRLFGRAITDAITLTASPTAVPIVPVLPVQFSGYLDATSAGLGTTKLTRLLAAEYSITNRFNPLWAVDAAQSSFVTWVETEPTAQIRILLEADAAGMARLPNMRAGTTEFVRLEAIGAIIASTFPYTFRIDAAVKWTEIEDFSDEDGVYAVRYTGTIVHDGTYGKSHSVRVINTLTAL